MALQKKIATKYGIDADYWKIVDLNINWLTENSHVVLCGWASKEAREEGLKPLAQRGFDWSGEKFPFTDEEPQNERGEAYEAIKNETTMDVDGNEIAGEFVDAIDC